MIVTPSSLATMEYKHHSCPEMKENIQCPCDESYKRGARIVSRTKIHDEIWTEM